MKETDQTAKRGSKVVTPQKAPLEDAESGCGGSPRKSGKKPTKA